MVIFIITVVIICIFIYVNYSFGGIVGGGKLNKFERVNIDASEKDFMFKVSANQERDVYIAEISSIIHNLPYPEKRYNFTHENILEMYNNLRHYEPAFINGSYIVTNITTKDPDFKTRYYLTYDRDIPGHKDLDYSKPIIIPSRKDSYNKIDIIADMFNELPRIKALGYGAQYSSFECWNNNKLHELWLGPLYDKKIEDFNCHVLREALYDVIPEPRQEKPASYKSVFSLIENPKILDVSSAYGDRLITALSMNIPYSGVDPWTDLFSGYSKIIDLFMSPTSAEGRYEMYNAPSEDVSILNKEFNMVVMSPAPFDVEVYAAYSEESKIGQSWNTYSNYDDWLICYIFATISKIYNYLEDDGIFLIKILDRTGKQLKKTSDISQCKTIAYTEITLLYSECIGFEYTGAIGYQSGGGSVVPWWTFRKRSDFLKKPYDRRRDALSLMDTHYPHIFNRIKSRLFLKPSFITVNINSDMYNGTVKNIEHEQPCLIREIIRKDLMEKIRESLSKAIPDIPLTEINMMLGRYLMVQSINNKMIHDPVFPTNGINYDQLLENATYGGIDGEKFREILTSGEFVLIDKKYYGIDALMHGAIIQLNIEFNKSKTKRINMPQRYIHSDIISFLREKFIRKDEIELFIDIMLTRYETLGADIHQHTRDDKRHDMLMHICGCDFETFAAPLNTFSKHYFSVFYDIDKYFGSYGNFFTSSLKSGIYLANPVNDPTFVTESYKYIMKTINGTKDKITFLFGIVTYNSEPYAKLGFNKARDDIREWYIKNGNMQYIKDILKSSKFAFIINNEKFKTIDHISRSSKVSKIVSIVCCLTNDNSINKNMFTDMM